MRHKIKSFITTAIALMLAAVILTASGCSANKKDVPGAESTVLISESSIAYDIVLALDESSSIHDTERKLRNMGSDALTDIISDDCRLGALFFSENVNNRQDMLSMSEENNRERFRKLFDPDNGRMVSADDGTNIGRALDQSFEMLGTSERNKVVFIFTDGNNYISNGRGSIDKDASAKADEYTKQQIQIARTLDNGDPVPVYLIYLDEHFDENDREKAEGIIASLLGLMSTPDCPAAYFDVSEDSVESWNGLEWYTQANKIIRVNDASMLPRVFTRVFYKLKNVGFTPFTVTPDENGAMPVGFDVPDFGVKSIRLTLSSDAPFTVERVYHIGTKTNMLSEPVRFAGGRTNIIDIPDISDTEAAEQYKDGEFPGKLPDGLWQLEITGDRAVHGTVACYSDFSAEARFVQELSASGELECCTDTLVSVRLLDDAGAALHIPSGVTSAILFDGASAELSVNGNSLVSDAIRLREQGKHGFYFTLNYGDMSYGARASLSLRDGAPVISVSEARLPLYTVKASGTEYADLGPVTDYIRDAHDDIPASLEVTDSSGKCVICTPSALGELEGTTVSRSDGSENGEAPHIYTTTAKKHILSVNATDSSGGSVSGKVSVRLGSGGTFLTVLLILLAAAAVYWLFKRLSASGTQVTSSGKQACNAYLSTVINDERYVCVIPMFDHIFSQANTQIKLSELNLLPVYGSSGAGSASFEDMPLVLSFTASGARLSSENSGSLSVKLPGAARSDMFGYRLVSEGGSEQNTRYSRELALEPGEKYIINCKGTEFTVALCDEYWFDMFNDIK